MFILVSSTYRLRYKEDILRTLSMPVGANMQFRYGRHYVETQLLNEPNRVCQKTALICSADARANSTRPWPLIPVRVVTLKQLVLHGCTVSVRFTTSGFPVHEPNEFTQQLATEATQVVPRNVEGAPDPEGYLFFEAPNSIDGTESRQIDNWENIVAQLYENSDYQEEPYFWAVLGLKDTQELAHEKELDFSCWPNSMQYDKEYTLATDVYHPDTKRWDDQKFQATAYGLSITHSESISTPSPDVISVDSPYDLKRWPFKVSRFRRSDEDEVWLRMGPTAAPPFGVSPSSEDTEKGLCTEHDNNNDSVGKLPNVQHWHEGWDILLPLKLDVPWVRVLLGVFLAGSFIGATGIPSIVASEQIQDETKLFASIVSIILGIIAALLVHFNVRKLV